jgi:3-hydroxyacyl-CoA dehydrogenase
MLFISAKISIPMGYPLSSVDIVQAALDAGSKKAQSKMAKTVEKKSIKGRSGSYFPEYTLHHGLWETERC